ncbi:hypothetical protein [Klebsiella pneumoniae]|uniref:hypothetical protein n=1 Tax=Klebsiella pneumoniae TaxID=573 RepID=UPI000E2B218A|nr:hypothetical protein [Klebsiella pneumoniae]SVK74126.1 Uncharacterised protein [Klebsiella pneumoniae]HBY5626434.1 hypothetical protein [Klebsiella pneumoniae]
MSHGKCEPTNTNAADYKLYARFDAGETLESVLASPPTTKHNKVLDVNYLGRYASTTLAAFELFLS